MRAAQMRVTAALAMLGLATAAGIVAPLTTVSAMRLRGGNVQFGHAAAKGGRKNAFQIAVCHDVHACACAPLVCDGRLLSGAGLEFQSLCVGASTAAAVLASLPARTASNRKCLLMASCRCASRHPGTFSTNCPT